MACQANLRRITGLTFRAQREQNARRKSFAPRKHLDGLPRQFPAFLGRLATPHRWEKQKQLKNSWCRHPQRRVKKPGKKGLREYVAPAMPYFLLGGNSGKSGCGLAGLLKRFFRV